MLELPPLPPLFPYTTLFRSVDHTRPRDAEALGAEEGGLALTVVRVGTCSWADEALSKHFYPPKLPARERLAWYAEHFDTRSEEHTSELQSHSDLVCRLLLEK